MSGAGNDYWIARVRLLLQEGYGVEDIALKLRCGVQSVRDEVGILRAMGALKGLWNKK